jgi:hypothetical protein
MNCHSTSLNLLYTPYFTALHVTTPCRCCTKSHSQVPSHSESYPKHRPDAILALKTLLLNRVPGFCLQMTFLLQFVKTEVWSSIHLAAVLRVWVRLTCWTFIIRLRDTFNSLSSHLLVLLCICQHFKGSQIVLVSHGQVLQVQTAIHGIWSLFSLSKSALFLLLCKHTDTLQPTRLSSTIWTWLPATSSEEARTKFD